MTRFEHIAHTLKTQTIGLTLSEIANRIDMTAFDFDKDKISSALHGMLKKNHIEKSGGFNNCPARWKITQQGRSYYSCIHDDETDAIQTPSSLSSDSSMDSTQQDYALADVQTVETGTEPAGIQVETNEQLATKANGPLLTSIDDQMSKANDHINTSNDQRLSFNTENTLDRALFGLVNLIRDVANQQPDEITIENKAEALTLLETMECNQLFSSAHRATFSRIRQAVEQLEDAA